MHGKRTTHRILLCGPARHSVSGVATHLNQLFGSNLAQKYSMLQFQVGSEGRSEGHVMKLVRLLASPALLFVAILRYKPDIIHLNSSLDPKAYWRDLTYLIVTKTLGRKIVYQVHGGALPSAFLGSKTWQQSILRWTLNLPDVLVLLAEVEREAYRASKVGKNIRVIPNAIDLDEYSTDGNKDYNKRFIRLGYIGRLAHDKGIKESIQALAILRQRGMVYLRLYIAGSGPFEKALRRIVKDLRLECDVKFVGPVFGEDKIRFWRETEIFLFPTSHREGLPYTILEAIASGTPVVTTRVGGIPDVIQDGVQGLLLDVHEPKAIATAVETLVNNPERLRSMSREAMYRARNHYGIDRLARQFDELYQEILA